MTGRGFAIHWPSNSPFPPPHNGTVRLPRPSSIRPAARLFQHNTINVPLDPAAVSPTGLVSGNNLERPNLIGNPNSGPQTPAEWFDTDAFALPAKGTYGTGGRNVVRGPALIDLDTSLQKDVNLYERLRLQFRLDAYNSLNHPNFNLPGRIFGAANFGGITSAGDPRELQWALKVIF